MYIEACWLNHLDAALEKYNNRVHGTTKMRPFEMSPNTNTAKLALQSASDINQYPIRYLIIINYPNFK